MNVNLKVKTTTLRRELEGNKITKAYLTSKGFLNRTSNTQETNDSQIDWIL